MHLLNQWLPPPVLEQVPDEKRRFSALVARVEKEWRPDDPTTLLFTDRWVPLIHTFLSAKSELKLSDLEALTSTALKLILCSTHNLHVQQCWGQCLTKILKKYRHELVLEISWRPLYELILTVHFERRHSYEGYALKRNHLHTMIALVRKCRRFFPGGSLAEIWTEFRPALEDVSHNSALEAAGFLSLLLPSPQRRTEDGSVFFTSEWVKECMDLWDALPHSNYWSLQWASLLGRCIKHHAETSLNWDPFLRTLYMHYLRTFEVPVGNSGSRPPFYRRLPQEVLYAFYSRMPPISGVVAKSIVYLLSPGGAGQRHLESLIDLLEQYYHPSNGGSWTSSLERFLRGLVFYFMKRIAIEQLTRAKSEDSAWSAQFLGPAERVAFVKGVMRLIERGQYSKNTSLAASAAKAASSLSYLEPKIVLPHVVSCFQTAMDTITATHQLQSSLTCLALTAHTLLLASAKEIDLRLSTSEMDTRIDNCSGSGLEISILGCRSTLMGAMFSTLLGLDANDPPKTLATLQLYCSVLSSVTMVGSPPAGHEAVFPIDWSLWVEMFLSRLFALLLNLEPPSFEPEADNGFLMDLGSQYLTVLELLFWKSTPVLYNQALKMVAKFVRGNILPGAADEIGMLCFAVVYARPSLALPQLVRPIMDSIILSLCESPSTGFSSCASINSSHDFKVGLSPALETTVSYQLKVLSRAVMCGGAALPPHKGLLKKVIAAAFDAPSSKVNEAGNTLLWFVISSLIHYYPLGSSKSCSDGMEGVEAWFTTKGRNAPREGSGPVWHIPSPDELNFVEELLELHMQDSIDGLQMITEDVSLVKTMGQERERLRVVLLRLEGSLQGVGSCLPDFNMPPRMNLQSSGTRDEHLTIVGAAGTSIGSTILREKLANTLHQTCEYMLKERADDTILLKLLVRLLNFVGNYGATDYSNYAQNWVVWKANSKRFIEPPANLITCSDTRKRRRVPAPQPVTLLLKDLLKLSLHSYLVVRISAGKKVESLLWRYPTLIKECIPLLTASLQDAQAKEETVLGACNVLMLMPVMQHLMEDWNALASFFLSLLGSSHHETVKAQNAISELFYFFNLLYRGVPFGSYANSGISLNEISYSKMIDHIQDHVVPGGPVAVHWRYNLMANGILLFLVLPPPSDAYSFDASTVTKSRESMAGGFIANLQSELPALRPVSVIALLFLLQAASSSSSTSSPPPPHDLSSTSSPSLKKALVSIISSPGFGHKVISNLALDHHYLEGLHSSSSNPPQLKSDAGLTALMPPFMRDWPRTRTWDPASEGDAFSSTFARLFHYLAQECGAPALDSLRGPLQDAVSDVEDRGKQCVAAEIMAGLLHSDSAPVLEAWDAFLGPLLRRALETCTVESAAEWAACVRFAVGGEGRAGRGVPALRHRVLACLAEPLLPEQAAATSLVAKRLTLLRAALNEILPGAGLPEDARFQAGLLREVTGYMSHRAPQVRQGVGKMMCILCANLHQSPAASTLTEEEEVCATDKQNHTTEDGKTIINWRTLLVDGALSASTKIRTEGGHQLEEASTCIEFYSAESKEAVRWMETVLFFMMAAVRSGNGSVLVDVLVQQLHPVLSLQETWNKELAKKAKTAMNLMRWQSFGSVHLGAAVSTVLTAAMDSNWHTRVAALKFMQPLIYRHTYIMAKTDLEALWVRVRQLLSDVQLEVRELAATTLAGMMKGEGSQHAKVFRVMMVNAASTQLRVSSRKRRSSSGWSVAVTHGLVLGLAACILSVPYDMPGWLPDMMMTLARFSRDPWPIRATVTKTIGEFRRTHMDTWDLQKTSFSEDQLEILSDVTSSASYFA